MPNTITVKDANSQFVTLDTQGTPINGQTLESGVGYGPIGWLSSLRKAITDNFTSLLARLPAALVGGRLDVNIGASSATVPVNNAGTFAVQDSQAVTDNAGFTDGTTKVQPAGFIFDEVAGTALTENDAAAARINANRSQIGIIEDGATRARYATVTAANALKVDNSAVTQPISAASLPIPTGAALDATLTARLPSALGSGGGVKVDIVSGGGSGTATDKAVFSEGTSPHTPIGGVLNDTITSDPTEDQTAAARITPKRALHSNLRNQAGTEIATSANPVRIDPTGTTAQPVTDNGNSLTVDNGGTFAVQDSQVVTDNAAFTDGTTKVQPAGFIYDEVAGTALTENDAGAARMNVNRSQVGIIEDGATRARYATVTAANALKVDNSAVTQPVSAASLPLPTGATTEATLAAQVVTDNAAFTDGTTKVQPAGFIYDEVAGTALTENDAGAARMNVNRSQVGIIEDGATRARYATVTAANALKVDNSAVTQPVSAASLPLPTGAALDATLTGGTQKAIARGAAKGTTTAADITSLAVDANHQAMDVTLATPLDSTNDEVRVVTCIPANIVSGFTASDMTTTANTSVVGAQGVGLRFYATTILVTNGHATQGTFVNILDGTTAIWSGYAGPAGGGFTANLRTPLRTTANTALQAACVTTGAAVRVSAAGFRGA